ncbi:MAG: hypothetical protein J0I34_18460 [Pseudonocardia sp.]|nr:hypothetical protein [Pseudonocardia sp.]ODU27124.1 MAG: hypothetical protein ABS80_04595 [Pseudonocardia sp. SCN 72-51]ODV04447.1 MAG: hypothetical protein ABT15_20985 [Pseudonocardia sp. SCN 73-27]
MSETSSRQQSQQSERPAGYGGDGSFRVPVATGGGARDEASGPSLFAGATLFVVGVFQAIEGLIALLRSSYYVVGSDQLVVQVGYPVWGWVHLVLGVLLVAVGVGVLAGNAAARVTGIVLAALSAIVNLAFIAAYPVWAIIVIAIDIVIIYALATASRPGNRPA